MKTVLIVEDEKMIRQGIKAMVQRSGVPVEVIMECNNGETALEIIKEQPIDVMFTDIRMPKMNGIELVQAMGELALDQLPLTVAISGYDDFSYAVEMLRNGVKEYLLKPVEREKIKEILEKLNQEIEHREKKKHTEKLIGYQQIKHLISGEELSKEEGSLLQQKYAQFFFTEDYVVCVADKSCKEEEQEAESVIWLNDLEDVLVCIVEVENSELLLKNELQASFVGVSQVHKGLLELKEAYEEAMEARKRSFFTGISPMDSAKERKNVPESIREQSLKLISEQAVLQRVQLIGTDKMEELAMQWEQFFKEAGKEHILPEEFTGCILGFLAEITGIYKSAIEETEKEAIESLKKIYQYGDLVEYEEAFLDLVMGLQGKINSQFDINKNQQKIQQAITYIQENYAKDLNMAVVSNHISMNYSLFSVSFKQVTGSNFVNFLKEIRIREAKKLLSDTDLRVIEISQAVGYENEKHFMKIFKSACGVSPSEYRKNMNRG